MDCVLITISLLEHNLYYLIKYIRMMFVICDPFHTIKAELHRLVKTAKKGANIENSDAAFKT